MENLESTILPMTESEMETYRLHRRFDRMGRLIGDSAMEKLFRSHVMIIGLGGVGSFAAESIARSGVGKITLLDFDEICITNFNRQLHSLQGLVGEKKTDVMAGLMAHLAEMQQDFIENDRTMRSMICEVDANYQESGTRLTRAMAHIQFQDVMRQRMEHVQGALVEMRDHMLGLNEKVSDPEWDGSLEQTFKTMLASHLDTYSMASQTDVHHSAAGNKLVKRDTCPAIELF